MLFCTRWKLDVHQMGQVTAASGPIAARRPPVAILPLPLHLSERTRVTPNTRPSTSADAAGWMAVAHFWLAPHRPFEISGCFAGVFERFPWQSVPGVLLMYMWGGFLNS